MKKNFFNFAMVAVVAIGAVTYTGCGKKGCTTEADDSYDSAATEEDPEACDESATVSKFEGSWIGQPGSYPFTVSQTGEVDYQFNINTNLGLLAAGGLTQLSPTNIKAKASQKEATIASQTFYDGRVSGTINYNSGSSMSITYTLTDFPTSADVNGTYTEAISK